MSRRRHRERRLPSGDLMLAAMVDMMVNILIFLLHLYGTDPGNVPASEDLQLAASTAIDAVQPGFVVLVMSKTAVTVDGSKVITLGGEGPNPTELDALGMVLSDRARKAQAKAPDPDKPVEIVVEIDKREPWSVLRPVLATVGRAGFGHVRFVVTAVSEHGAGARTD